MESCWAPPVQVDLGASVALHDPLPCSGQTLIAGYEPAPPS
ncbi:hypothetical protein [Streptomyces sp. NPDC053431]